MLARMTDEQRRIYEWIGELPVVVPNWDKRLPEIAAIETARARIEAKPRGESKSSREPL
jgi:hypothetical protein